MILADGSKMEIAKVYPLDAVFDTPADVPEDVKTNKRYAGLDSFTISECAAKVKADYPKIDILVHSLANGPEVTKPLLETSSCMQMLTTAPFPHRCCQRCAGSCRLGRCWSRSTRCSRCCTC